MVLDTLKCEPSSPQSSRARTPGAIKPITLVYAQTKAEGGAGAIRPFHVHFPDEALVDLKHRITATRWPEREIVTNQSQGVQLATVQKLARCWA